MSDQILLNCPYCGDGVPADSSVCPDCQEDLSSLIRLRYEHAIYYNEALAAAREAKYDRALVKAYLAIERKEDFAPAHILLAKVYGRRGEWDQADRVVSQALEIAPGDADLRSFAEELMALSAQAREAQRQEAEPPQPPPAEGLPGPSPSDGLRGQNASRYLTVYERDVKRAFGLGAAVATVLALFISWIGGKPDRED